MSTYFKIDQALDNTIMRIIEDSILCNPNIEADDKSAIITSLCYSLPYEVKDEAAQRYTSPIKYKSLHDKQIKAQAAAPELLAALEIIMESIVWQGGVTYKIKDGNLEAARAAIAKAQG